MHRYFLLFFLILPFPILSQENITVQLQVPPERGVPLDESFMAIITNSGEPAEVFLQGRVQEEEDGLIFEGSSSLTTLEQGVTRLNRRNLSPIQPTQNISMKDRYQNYVTRASRFPPGSYRFCLQIVRAETEEVIAEDCYEKTIENYLPPSLISPERGSKVRQHQPIFTWSPVPGTHASSINYKLEIVELQGNQSPIAAFESNPAWYQEEGLTSPLFHYPIAAREFIKDQQYAWKVTAFVGGSKISESEVWSFRYQQEADTTAQEEEKEKQDTTQTLLPEQYARLKAQIHSGYYLLDDFILRFIYNNPYATTQLSCRLENAKNEIVARNILKKKQHTGMNFNRMDMSSRVQPGETYRLRCAGATGEIRQLKFRIREQNGDNVIRDMNIDEDLFEFQDGIFNNGG